MTLAVVNQNITWCCSGGSAEPLAQLARAGKGCHRLVRGRPLGRDQAGPESELEVKLQPVLSGAVRQMGRGLDTSLQVRDGFEIGRAHGGLPAGLQPICLRLLEQTRLRQVVRESFGLSLHDFRKPLLEGVRDRGVERCASALQQS